MAKINIKLPYIYIYYVNSYNYLFLSLPNQMVPDFCQPHPHILFQLPSSDICMFNGIHK